MGTKTRILGADALLRGITEVTYGTAPTSGYKLLAFKSFGLDSERPLGYDPLLGQGRDAADPYYDAITVSGDIGIPLDVRNLGFWLHGLLGTDTSANVGAKGDFYFSALPAVNSTITLNGTAWTFVASGATGNQTNIGASVSATVTALATNLNASASPEVAKVTYVASGNRLLMTFDTVGTTGNTYTLAASATSNATPSNATLWGGGYQHQFTSGGVVPSKTLEVGHTQLTTTQFIRYLGCMCGTLTFDMSRTGPANGVVNVIAQQRTSAAVTIDGSATGYTLDRFSQGRGSIRLNGAPIANVTAGSFEFSNNLDPVLTIRSDGLIDGVDAGEARANGSITVRAGSDTTISDQVTAETPVQIELTFSKPTGEIFQIYMPRVFLPKPKATINGPGGVEQVFDWQAAKDSTAGYLARFYLVNDQSAAYS